MDGIIPVQFINKGKQLFFPGIYRQDVLKPVHARFDRHLVFIADIDLACGILSHQHHCEAWRQTVVRLHFTHRAGDSAAQLGRKGLSVNNVSFRHFNLPAGAPRPMSHGR